MPVINQRAPATNHTKSISCMPWQLEFSWLHCHAGNDHNEGEGRQALLPLSDAVNHVQFHLWTNVSCSSRPVNVELIQVEQ